MIYYKRYKKIKLILYVESKSENKTEDLKWNLISNRYMTVALI